MTSVTHSVEELVNLTPDRNNSDYFTTMWSILCELKDRLDARFPLKLDPSVEDLASYGSGVTQGHLTASSGGPIDWLIHSFIGTPGQSFTNMHLTVWLGPEIDVPHFGMALGTIPDMFFYLDYIPRVDLMADLDYLDRYYNAHNDQYLAFERNPDFVPFVSRCLYMRQAQSRNSLCYLAKPTQPHFDLVRQTAHKMMDDWLKLIDEARPVPHEKREALAARDLQVRRAITERDPANVMGEKIFGKELTDRLVGALWGKGRQSQLMEGWKQ